MRQWEACGCWWGTDDDRAKRGHREVSDKSGWVFVPHIPAPPPRAAPGGVHAPVGQYPNGTSCSDATATPSHSPRQGQGCGQVPFCTRTGTVQAAVAPSGRPPTGNSRPEPCRGDGVILQRPRNRQARPCLDIDHDSTGNTAAIPCKYVQRRRSPPSRPPAFCWGRKDRPDGVDRTRGLGGRPDR